MATLKLVLPALLQIFLLAGSLLGQTVSIDSLKIRPSSPVTSDIVKVIAYTTFSSGGCRLTDSSFNIISSTINVYASHTLGMLTYICKSTDTLTIGRLSSGTYDLVYHLTGITSRTVSDVKTVRFSVGQSTDLVQPRNDSSRIRIYPNPASTEINVDMSMIPANRKSIEIFSSSGQKIKTITTEKNLISIGLSNLASGYYYIEISFEDGRRWVRRMVKQ
jgi:hypothetical protein